MLTNKLYNCKKLDAGNSLERITLITRAMCKQKNWIYIYSKSVMRSIKNTGIKSPYISPMFFHWTSQTYLKGWYIACSEYIKFETMNLIY